MPIAVDMLRDLKANKFDPYPEDIRSRYGRIYPDEEEYQGGEHIDVSYDTLKKRKIMDKYPQLHSMYFKVLNNKGQSINVKHFFNPFLQEWVPVDYKAPPKPPPPPTPVEKEWWEDIPDYIFDVQEQRIRRLKSSKRKFKNI